MPLKPCRECGRQVSTEATKCPQCGVPLKEGILDVMVRRRKKDSPVEMNWPLRVTIVMVLLAVMLIVWILAQRR
jgi:uncharacterized membrane protein YvbJ